MKRYELLKEIKYPKGTIVNERGYKKWVRNEGFPKDYFKELKEETPDEKMAKRIGVILHIFGRIARFRAVDIKEEERKVGKKFRQLIKSEVQKAIWECKRKFLLLRLEREIEDRDIDIIFDKELKNYGFNERKNNKRDEIFESTTEEVEKGT